MGQIFGFLAKYGLKRISDLRPHLVLERHIVPKTFLRESVGENLGFCKKRRRRGRRKRRRGFQVWISMDLYGFLWIVMVLYGFVNFCMDSWILCLGFGYEKF